MPAPPASAGRASGKGALRRRRFSDSVASNMDVLERLFASPSRARLLRLFLMNPDARFPAAEAMRQARLSSPQFRSEILRLAKLGLVRAATDRIELPPARLAEAPAKRAGRGTRRKTKTVRARVFFADRAFPLFSELKALILKSAPHAKGQLALPIRRLGNVKLAILAGVFIDNPHSRVDLLLVGDGIKTPRLKGFIQWLESRLGRELEYAAMTSKEFGERMDLYDRFLTDILESPHETVVNKLGV